MEKRAIGSLSVSVVGVGCNNFGARLDAAATERVVHGALDAGVTLFDTADTYGGTQSEVLLGRALGARRDEAVVATKFGMPLDDQRFGASPAYVRAACDASLARLGLDYIDLYQLHYPDEATPIADTLGALQELVAAGKVREVGCSNFTAAQLREARDAAGAGPAFASVQNQFSLLAREPERDGVLATCEELGVAFLPFYPLANGLLTGKVRPGEPIPEGTRLALMAPERSAHWLSESLQRRVASLLAFADEVGVPILTLAVSWLLSHAAVASVIAGASSPDQVRANVEAVTTIDPKVLSHLDELTA
jgi:aryl-alcohol dehydrogenase-like predicted oxidoreductase